MESVLLRSRPPNLLRPTFYLDTSTICDAFRREHAAYQPLLAWLERVAVEANLCVSTFHFQELGTWHDVGMVNEIADWLEEVPTVWARSFDDVINREFDYWLRIAAGLAPAEDAQPFAPSFLSVFRELRPEATPDGLKLHARELVKILRDTDVEHRAGTLEMAERFHSNRAWVRDEGWSEERKAEDLALQARTDIRERAIGAHERLSASDALYRALGLTAGSVQDPMVDLAQRVESSLPAWRVSSVFGLGFGASAAKKVPGSRRWRSLESSGYDFMHATVGAAYADVFTCDGDVSDYLGDVRSTFGRDRQLCARELSPALFVSTLMDTWR